VWQQEWITDPDYARPMRASATEGRVFATVEAGTMTQNQVRGHGGIHQHDTFRAAAILSMEDWPLSPRCAPPATAWRVRPSTRAAINLTVGNPIKMADSITESGPLPALVSTPGRSAGARHERVRDQGAG